MMMKLFAFTSNEDSGHERNKARNSMYYYFFLFVFFFLLLFLPDAWVWLGWAREPSTPSLRHHLISFPSFLSDCTHQPTMTNVVFFVVLFLKRIVGIFSEALHELTIDFMVVLYSSRVRNASCLIALSIRVLLN
jgi:hypothetical protein